MNQGNETMTTLCKLKVMKGYMSSCTVLQRIIRHFSILQNEYLDEIYSPKFNFGRTEIYRIPLETRNSQLSNGTLHYLEIHPEPGKNPH